MNSRRLTPCLTLTALLLATPAFAAPTEKLLEKEKLVKMEKEGKLKRVPFQGRDQMKKLVDPVMAAYAKEIGAEQILAKINSIK